MRLRLEKVLAYSRAVEVVLFIAALLCAYLLGSIPTGFLVAKAKGIDIRKVGSGNIGATNAFRILGKGAGSFVLVVDALKGWAGCRIVPWIFEGAMPEPAAIPIIYWIIGCGLFAILGHNYPVWLKFKGGKGIATSAGVLIGMTPIALAIGLALWVITLWGTRYVSVASIVAAAALPIIVWLIRESGPLTAVTALMAAMAIYKHRGNIQRLIQGTEPKIGKRKTAERGDAAK